ALRTDQRALEGRRETSLHQRLLCAANCQTARLVLSRRRGLSSCLFQRLRVEIGPDLFDFASTMRKKSKIGTTARLCGQARLTIITWVSRSAAFVRRSLQNR